MKDTLAECFVSTQRQTKLKILVVGIIFSSLPPTSCGEPLATWLAVWTFSQVVSMSALQVQSNGFDHTVARNATI